jgi:aquaporin Z
MGVMLFASNRKKLVSFSPLLVAFLTIGYYGFCSSLSGFSVNPARSVSSALFAFVWQGIWIYLAAPTLGMLAAASLYTQLMRPGRIYCAKVFHDMQSPCPFICDFKQLYFGQEHRSAEAEPEWQAIDNNSGPTP